MSVAKVEDKPQASLDQGDDSANGPDAGEGQAANDVVETTIVLTGVDTDDTDEVVLCGASALLGDWDPVRAQPILQPHSRTSRVPTTAPSRPSWSSAPAPSWTRNRRPTW
jgi:hypothetical protein